MILDVRMVRFGESSDKKRSWKNTYKNIINFKRSRGGPRKLGGQGPSLLGTPTLHKQVKEKVARKHINGSCLRIKQVTSPALPFQNPVSDLVQSL